MDRRLTSEIRNPALKGGMSDLFPPEIRWSREWGWLLVQDPEDGTWFSIPARGAPSGWVQIANEAKAAARARLMVLK